MTVVIRHLTGPDDLATFQQLEYVLDDEYAADLEQARRRPEWMWLALRDEHLVARAAWWGRAGDAGPLLMDVLDVDPAVPDRHDVAVALVRHALAAMDLDHAPPEYGRYLPVGWRDDPAETALVLDRTSVIEALGGRLLVERLRLRWGPGASAPADRERLTFRPPAGRDELLDLLTRVLEGTLDQHDRSQLRTRSPREVASDNLDTNLSGYRGPRDWWAIGCRSDGEPVGFVIPTRNDYSWIIAFIGVVPEHRGNGYIDDLLDHGTRVLAGHGAPAIKAATDRQNVPMAKSFHRCGYLTVGEEIDYSFPHAITDRGLPTALVPELRRRYAEPHRRYHDLRHLDDVLTTVDRLAVHATDADTVRLAAWFHDAVYDPARTDNEQESAALAGQLLPLHGIGADTVAEVARLVRLTATHLPEADDSDGAVLCDADLAVLARAPEAYDDYAREVREEYGHVPDEQFATGRAQVLLGIAARPAIYRTPEGHGWEAAARANLSRELTRLGASGGAVPRQ